MNYIPADKLIAEIGHSKIRRYVDPYSESYEGGFNDGYNECCDDVLKVIASLRQEPPSLPSNLDGAAEEYAKETFIKECIKNGTEAFKAGAEWMAGQYEKHRVFPTGSWLEDNGVWYTDHLVGEESGSVIKDFGECHIEQPPQELIDYINEHF